MLLSNMVFENPVENFSYLFNCEQGLLGASRGSNKQIATDRADAGHVNPNRFQGCLSGHGLNAKFVATVGNTVDA